MRTESEKLADSVTPLVALAALEEGEGVRVELEGRPAFAVFLSEGKVHVIDDLCTHGSASLADGQCDEGEVECPFHFGRFCLKTGKATHAPCYEPIAVHKVAIVDGMVCLVEPDDRWRP